MTMRGAGERKFLHFLRMYVIFYAMKILSTSPADLETAAPELVRRLSVILMGLAALVAARFLRNPRLVGLIGPLWRRLTRVAGRVSRVMARQPVRVRVSRGGARDGRPAAGRLPQGRLWLVRELGWEAAGFGCQLEALLAEPGMRAVLDGVPGVGRILRPICRMLGVVVPAQVAEIGPVAAASKPARACGVAGAAADLPWEAGPQPGAKIGG